MAAYTQTHSRLQAGKQTAEQLFEARRERIETVEQTYKLPRLTIGSPKQVMYGSSVRAKMISAMVTNLDPVLTAFARDITDSTWWIALSLKADPEAWILRRVFSVTIG